MGGGGLVGCVYNDYYMYVCMFVVCIPVHVIEPDPHDS